MLAQIWHEEAGFILTLELVVAAVLLVLAVAVGQQVLRDAVAQEIADLGMAVGVINNSYTTATSSFLDTLDANDNPTPSSGSPSGGLVLGLLPSIEF